IRLEGRNCVDATLPRREPLIAQPILNRACHLRAGHIRWQHEILVPDGVVRCDVAAAFQMMASESMRLVNDRMDWGSGEGAKRFRKIKEHLTRLALSSARSLSGLV